MPERPTASRQAQTQNSARSKKLFHLFNLIAGNGQGGDWIFVESK